MATWDQAHLYYLVLSRLRDELAAEDWGALPLREEVPPWTALKKVAEDSGYGGGRLLMVMPRTQLDLTTVEVPEADGDELASLIQTDVEGQIGDGEHGLVTDFFVLGRSQPPRGPSGSPENTRQNDGANDGGEAAVTGTVSAVAFSTDADRFEQWQQTASANQFELAGVTSRQLAPLGALRRQRVFRGGLSVLVAVYAGEVELSFFQGERLAFIRTFRAGRGSTASLAEQIQLEIQRTLSTVALDNEGEPAELLLLCRDAPPAAESAPENASDDDDAGVGDAEDGSQPLHEALDARLVRVELPSVPPRRSDDGQLHRPDPALVGAAMELLEHRLPIDLTNPKRPAPPPNPLPRWGAIAAFAACGLMVVGWVLWSDVRQLADQVETARRDVEQAQEVADKLQEKADETRFVQQWLGDQVDWLAHMNKLTEQFPDGQSANVRRLTASAAGNVGVFDLSIQVRDPRDVAELENRLRGAGFTITSEQLSEQTSSTEYPWAFEARVTFPIDPLEQREESLELEPESPETVEEAI